MSLIYQSVTESPQPELSSDWVTHPGKMISCTMVLTRIISSHTMVTLMMLSNHNMVSTRMINTVQYTEQENEQLLNSSHQVDERAPHANYYDE